MSSTFLVHMYNNCGGNIVIDASMSAKLYAPSFSINTGGITNLTLDIDIVPGGELIPSFRCRRCGLTIGFDDIGSHLSAFCQVCGHRHPVSDLSVHAHIPTICNGCISRIMSFCTGDGNEDRRIKDYVEVYSLTKRLDVVRLETVLKSPITL